MTNKFGTYVHNPFCSFNAYSNKIAKIESINFEID